MQRFLDLADFSRDQVADLIDLARRNLEETVSLPAAAHDLHGVVVGHREAAAGQADARVAEIDLQIAEAQQEPMPERANLIRNLMKLRNTAQREAANARLQLQSGHSEVQQASTDLLAARGAADAAVAAAQAAGLAGRSEVVFTGFGEPTRFSF